MEEFVTAIASTYDEATRTETHLWENGEITSERYTEDGEIVYFQCFTGAARECFTVENGNVQAVVEMEDTPLHTSDHPFCADETCPCHADDTLFDEYVLEPMLEGLLTSYEASRILWNEQI